MPVLLPAGLLPLLLACLLPACAPGSSDPANSQAGPVEPLFSMAILADPHMAGGADREARLRACVDWVNAEADSRDIELVLILGDIGWGEGLEASAAVLDELLPTWVPVIGDNEIHFGDEARFETVFRPQLDRLADTLDGWTRPEAPVIHPETGAEHWFDNYSFDHRGLHFTALDFNARGIGGLAGELGYLHDLPGGTFDFLLSDLAAQAAAPENGVVLFSHIPIHIGAFELAELELLLDTLRPRARQLYAHLAGHVHTSYEVDVDGLFTTYVTDAVWDDDNSFRVIEVLGNGERFEYRHELVTLD